jgi:serine/threonine-protein kinase
VRRVLLFAAAAGVAFLTGLGFFHFGMLAFVRSGAETKVPDLVGLDVTIARSALDHSGFTSVVEREIFSPDFGEGRVVEHRPTAGEVLRKGRKVWLTVSLGVRKTETPNIVGQSYRQAGIALDRGGLTVGSVSRLHHASVPRGQVVSQDPPFGAQCAEGTRVDLLVSLGPPPDAWVLPDLTGRPAREVESLLQRHGIRVGEKTVLIDRAVLPSTVLEHEPPAGSRVESGSEVDLVMSSRR